MVLLIAVAVGVAAGFIRTKFHKQSFRNVNIQHLWLVFLAYIPQFFAFYSPSANTLADKWIPTILIGSQVMLLVFALINRRLPGFALLGLGLLANFSAIALNGGFMPTFPDVIRRLVSEEQAAMFRVGERILNSKDMLMLRENTLLWFLGDVLTLPSWANPTVAFSFGDIVISMGAFWFFWELGRPQKNSPEVSP